MKLTRSTFIWAVVSILAVAAIFALSGHPLVPPEALAGLGMLPLGAGITIGEIAETINEQNVKIKAWHEQRHAEYEEMKAIVQEVQLKSNRLALGGGNLSLNGMMPAERKAIDSAVRALIAGDKAKADQLFVEAKAMSAGSGPDGGYVVHTQLSQGFTKVMEEVSPVFRLARVIDLDPGNDSFEEPIDRDTADASWVGEATSRPETDTPQLGMFRVALNEIYAMPKTTQTLLDVSSLDVLTWLQTKVGEAFGTKESDAFHNGDGVARPRGFLTYPIVSTVDASRTWGELQYVPTGAAGGFPITGSDPADCLINTVTAMKPQYRLGAVWLMNRNTAGTVRKLKDADGRYIWSDSLVLGAPSTLLGYSVEIDEDMPDVGANAYPIAFGNFQRAYTIVQKPGIKFLPDPFSSKPHVLLYSYRRVGGGMNNSEAIKLLKCATS